jgi:DNA-binding GntR family transcriptional regulator
VVDIVKDPTITKGLPPASLRARVESSLASAIISGELEPGTMVSVPVLAAQFEVSITPVREAMLNLEDRGFVESVKNKGFKVTEVSARDLHEIAQLRCWLEAPAMRLVAERLRTSSPEPYREMARRVSERAALADREAYLAAHSAFHGALLALTGNQHLVELVAELRRQTRTIGLAEQHPSEEILRSAAEHEELLDLLALGDGEAAERFMAHHIGHSIGSRDDLDEDSVTSAGGYDLHLPGEER